MPYLDLIIAGVHAGEIAIPALMRMIAAWRTESGASDAEVQALSQAIFTGVAAKCAAGILKADAEIAAAKAKLGIV